MGNWKNWTTITGTPAAVNRATSSPLRQKDSFEIGRTWAGMAAQFCLVFVLLSLVGAMFAGTATIAAAVVLLFVFFALIGLVIQLEILMELWRQRG